MASDENDRLNILLDEKEILVAQLTALQLKEETSLARIKELGEESNQRQEREAELTSEIRNLKQEQSRILHRDYDLVSEKVSFHYHFILILLFYRIQFDFDVADLSSSYKCKFTAMQMFRRLIPNSLASLKRKRMSSILYRKK